MIKKSELIKLLENTISLEEKAIPIYTRHLESAIFWLDMDNDRAGKIKNILHKLSRDSQRHYEVVMSLLRRVKDSGKDAF